jgi:hypothetical protein
MNNAACKFSYRFVLCLYVFTYDAFLDWPSSFSFFTFVSLFRLFRLVIARDGLRFLVLISFLVALLSPLIWTGLLIISYLVFDTLAINSSQRDVTS